MTFAERSVRISSAALVAAHSSGGEDDPLDSELHEVAVRLDQTERSIEVWRDHSGPLAYRTRAPCLRAALLQLRAALIAASRPVPPEIQEAESMLEDVGGHCGRVTRGAPSTASAAR